MDDGNGSWSIPFPWFFRVIALCWDRTYHQSWREDHVQIPASYSPSTTILLLIQCLLLMTITYFGHPLSSIQMICKLSDVKRCSLSFFIHTSNRTTYHPGWEVLYAWANVALTPRSELFVAQDLNAVWQLQVFCFQSLVLNVNWEKGDRMKLEKHHPSLYSKSFL